MNWKHKTSSKSPDKAAEDALFVGTETAELRTGAAWVSIQQKHHVLVLFSLFPGHLPKSNARGRILP